MYCPSTRKTELGLSEASLGSRESMSQQGWGQNREWLRDSRGVTLKAELILPANFNSGILERGFLGRTSPACCQPVPFNSSARREKQVKQVFFHREHTYMY